MHRQTMDPDAFRWRGGEISRVEGFSDAVFAFALTLLVVSLEVPRSFQELTAAMSGFLAFAACFAIFVWIWYEHYAFFRKYGLHDSVTIALNSVLLFVVLFYVYPLKFMFAMLSMLMFGVGGAHPPVLEADHEVTSLMISTASASWRCSWCLPCSTFALCASRINYS
jgi:hypothetical protein